MVHSQPVHLAREFFAELVEELLVQELLLEGFQDSRLDLLTPDGEPVVADALLTSAEACESIAAGHDEAGAAHAALRQPREEVLRSPREADVAGACDRSPRYALAVLRGVPEFVAHYPEGRKLLGDPLCLRIQPRDAFAGVRILDVPQPVPDQATDVQLVVQDARTALRVAVDGAWTPGRPKRSGDPVMIQPLRNRFRRDSCDVLPEDAVHDRSFPWLDFSLARREGATGQRFHDAVAVTESARRLAALDASAQSSMRLVGQVLQEQRVHRALEADVQVRDVAFGERDDVDAGEGQALEESGGVFLVAAEAVQ